MIKHFLLVRQLGCDEVVIARLDAEVIEQGSVASCNLNTYSNQTKGVKKTKGDGCCKNHGK